MSSMYESVQYHGQCVQEHTASQLDVQECTVSWPGCTGAHGIIASMYKSIKYCGKHIQKYTVLWQAHKTKHNIMANLYKSTDYYCQLVQEHTASRPAYSSVYRCLQISEHTAS